jgi:hypothetical protein
MKKIKATATATTNHVEPLLLFPVTLTRQIKPYKKLKLNKLNYIIIKVVFYRAQTGLLQCYNWQNFGHVWADQCKEDPSNILPHFGV